MDTRFREGSLLRGHRRSKGAGRLLWRSRAAALLVLAMTLGVACSQAAPAATGASAVSAQPKEGGSVRVGLSSDIATLDPAVWVNSWEVQIGHQIYDPLVTLDSKEPRVKPALAESWQVSTNGLTYTFKLRTGVRFHDGSRFDATAAKANFDRLTSAPAGSLKASDALALSRSVATVTAPDDTTLILTLKTPMPSLLTTLHGYLIVSPTAVAKYGAEYGQHPVGTGPFRVKEWIPKDRLVLERNPDYTWARGGSAHQGRAYLDELTYRFVSDPPARVLALESGDVDVITDVPVQDGGRLAGDARLRLYRGATPGQPLTLFLNVNRGPLADKDVRTAIQQTLDRAGLIQAALFGQRTAAQGLLTSSTPCFSDHRSDLPARDPSAAKATLDRAGWVAGAGGTRAKDGKPLRAELVVFPPYANMATAIQGQLREIGVDITPRVMEIPTAVPLLSSGQAEMWISAGANVDPGILERFHSQSIGSAIVSGSITKDPRNDDLLDMASKESDLAKRCALYDEFQRRFLQTGAAYPLYEAALEGGTKATLQGIRLEPAALLSPLFYDVWVAGK